MRINKYFQVYFDTAAFDTKTGHFYAKLLPEAKKDKENEEKHMREGEGELSNCAINVYQILCLFDDLYFFRKNVLHLILRSGKHQKMANRIGTVLGEKVAQVGTLSARQ